MPYDAGSLARLFQINFAPSFHYQLPNPTGIRTGTELQPIAQGAGVLANTRTVGPAGGVPLYYSNGFLSAGAGQTSTGGTGGGGLLSAITSGLETFLPAIFGGGGGAVARTPPTLPAMKPPSAIQRTMGAITKTAQQHPVLTAAGGAAATAAGAVIGRRVARGGRVAQLPDGTLVHMRRHRRMNPCNIRALRRGLRRAHAFERIARKVLHFTNPRKSHGVAHFKRARKRS